MAKSNPSGESWASVASAFTTMSVEAGAVMALRLRLFSRGGGEAGREAWRMVSEKFTGAWHLQTAALGGRLGHRPVTVAGSAVRYCATKVGENRRRLQAGERSRRHARRG